MLHRERHKNIFFYFFFEFWSDTTNTQYTSIVAVRTRYHDIYHGNRALVHEPWMLLRTQTLKYYNVVCLKIYEIKWDNLYYFRNLKFEINPRNIMFFLLVKKKRKMLGLIWKFYGGNCIFTLPIDIVILTI